MRFAVEGRNNKGSITVEASIIVPVVILSICAVIYMGLLLYQKAVMQSAVEMAAEAGADAWVSGVSEISTGQMQHESFERIRLYRRFIDKDKETRLQAVEAYALSMAGRGELLDPSGASAEAVVKDYAVCRKLEVTLVKQYSVPLGNFLKMFGGSGKIEICVKAASSINEPVELVRTTDFILDLVWELEKNNPEVSNFGETTRNTIKEIKEKLNKFLN